MSFFNKMFGKKLTDDAIAAEPQEINFVTALSMHLRGEIVPALSAYLDISEQFPDDDVTPFFVAVIKADKGETVEAAEHLRSLSQRIALRGKIISKAVTVDLITLVSEEPLIAISSVAHKIVSCGDLLKAEGFLQESAVCFEIATGLVPDHADVLYKFGDTLHDLRIYDYAESVLKTALQLAPNHWGSMYTYAVLLQDLGRDEEALFYFDKAATYYPDHAKCHNNYGAALMRTGRLEEALAQCTLAAELDPDSPFVKINLGNIYLLMQEYEKARTCFSEIISLDSQIPDAYFGLASAERLLHCDTARIRELYLKAIELNPAVPEFHHELGKFLAGHDNPEALVYFSTAAGLNNNLKGLHKDFGLACFHLGQQNEALEHLRIALQECPDDHIVQELLVGIEDCKLLQ